MYPLEEQVSLHTNNCINLRKYSTQDVYWICNKQHASLEIFLNEVCLAAVLENVHLMKFLLSVCSCMHTNTIVWDSSLQDWLCILTWYIVCLYMSVLLWVKMHWTMHITITYTFASKPKVISIVHNVRLNSPYYSPHCCLLIGKVQTVSLDHWQMSRNITCGLSGVTR